MTRASGTFVVKMTPQASGIAGIDRMSIDKQFQGDLKGSSKVEMLAVSTNVKNSPGMWHWRLLQALSMVAPAASPYSTAAQ